MLSELASVDRGNTGTMTSAREAVPERPICSETFSTLESSVSSLRIRLSMLWPYAFGSSSGSGVSPSIRLTGCPGMIVEIACL
jgi:hypothetical protein